MYYHYNFSTNLIFEKLQYNRFAGMSIKDAGTYKNNVILLVACYYVTQYYLINSTVRFRRKMNQQFFGIYMTLYHTTFFTAIDIITTAISKRLTQKIGERFKKNILK